MFKTITDNTEIDVAVEVLISPVVNYKWMKSSLRIVPVESLNRVLNYKAIVLSKVECDYYFIRFYGFFGVLDVDWFLAI